MKNNRTANTTRNIIFGLISRIVNLILPFIIRTIILRKLGAEYTGLGSLFTSILQVLSVAELGFSSAIVFSLYKPVAEDDTDEICALLLLYKRIYQIVGSVIFGAGILLLPFLNIFIKGGYPSDINIYILYIIYLLNTVVSYFAFGYKNVIFVAYQKQNIISKVEISINFIRSIIQIVVLVICSNYYLYIIWLPMFTIVSNVLIGILSRKYYPELVCKGKVQKEKFKNISKQIKGIAIGRLSLTARNSFDSIILSMLCGLVPVAIYSNYYYVFSSVGAILGVLLQGMAASVGNSIVTETVEKNYDDHNKFDFYYSWIVSWCFVCLLCLYQPFMKLWAGEDLIFPFHTMILFCVYFYVNQLAQVRSVYSEAVGLWWEFRYISVIEMFSNLFLNLILGWLIGVDGIIFATIITAFFSSFIAVTIITFKKYFNCSAQRYFLNSFIYVIVTIISGGITFVMCSLVKLNGINELIVRFIICVFVPNIIFFCFYKYRYWKYMKDVMCLIKNVR